MIDMHFVVQGQRMVAFAPIVADPFVPVDDQRVVELTEPGGDVETGLPGTDDNDLWIAIFICLCGFALIEPIRSPEVSGIGFALWSVPADLFFMAFQFLECGEKSIRQGPRYPAQDEIRRCPTEFGLDRNIVSRVSVPARVTTRGGVCPGRSRSRTLRFLLRFADGLRESGCAVYRGQMPGEGEDVAPM